MFWLWAFYIVLIFVIAALVIKIVLLHKAMDEICAELSEKLEIDTNTLLTTSSNDRHLRWLAAKLNTQLRLLRKARRRFETGDSKLKEAVTNVSHDLRTPLTAISGYLELLKREEIPENISRYLAVIEDRSNALKQLTEELFCYSVSTSASESIVFEQVNINSVLEESISAYYAALKGCGITPVITLPRQKICRKLDRFALSRIFGNIISNAIKYSDGDLEIVLTEEGKILFSNSALELDEVQAGKLFDRFYTVRDAGRSTGIGLSIARELTEQMNGKITAYYKKGRLRIEIVFTEKEVLG